MGEFPHYGKGKIPIAGNFRMGYFPPMSKRKPITREAMERLDAFVRGLRIITDTERVDWKPLSEAAGMSETGVKDLFRNQSSPKVVNAIALAKAVGRSVDDVIRIGEAWDINAAPARATVAVAGKVGAGAHVDLVDAYAKGGGLYSVACPPQLSPHGIVAVEVEGDSMVPLYAPGTVLFYSRDVIGVPTEAIGQVCVCEDENGKAWVKHIKTGMQEGTFSLISVNPEAENMHGVRLKWAAKVRFHLAPEMVERVE